MANKDTSCKECIFSVYEEETQTGCKLQTLDTYKKNGVDILEAYDDEKAFFVIRNRICPNYRTNVWLSKRTETDLDSLEWAVYEENKISYALLINFNEDLQKFKELIRALNTQSIQPSFVCIIRDYKSKVVPGDICDILEEFLNKGIFWSVKNPFGERFEDKIINSIDEPYIIHIGDNYIPDKDLSKAINYFINIDLGVFGVIKLTDQSYVIPKSVHKYWYYRGDLKKSVVDNIKESECQTCPKKKIVYQIEEILR